MLRRIPLTLVLGLAIIGVCEALLLVDAARRGWATVPLPPGAYLPMPHGWLERAARWVAVNMTAVCWVGYLLTFDGLLTWLARRRGSETISSIRSRPNRFLVAWLTSIPVWCVFDWINFYYMDAWRYHGLPPLFAQRLLGYFIAFAAISPGMFLAAQLYQHLGVRRLRTTAAAGPAWGLTLGVLFTLAVVIVLVILGLDVAEERRRFLLASATVLVVPGLLMLIWKRCLFLTSFAFGLGFTGWAIYVHDPIGNLALWVGMIFLLDPVNAKMLGQPSLLLDWRAGRWGRTAALFLGGATCGLCWEFWNFWALAKWTYHLPFLGAAAGVRYFEMPLLGFLGFLPFAAECWVMLNVIVGLLERAKLRVAEPLPSDDDVM